MKRRLVAMLILALAACNPKPTGTAPSATQSPSPTPSGLSLIVRGQGTTTAPVRFIQSDKQNRRQYDLSAKSFQSVGSPGSERVELHDVHGNFHGRDGSVLQAQAPLASLDQVRNTVELTGGVHATNGAGTTLTCDNLMYDRATGTIEGTGNVVITDPQGFRATGSRVDSDVSLTHTRMQ